MRVDPFKISDYAEIEIGNGLGLENWDAIGGIFPTLRAMEASGTYYTVREDGKVILIGGYIEFIKGVCEVSFYPSIYFLNKPLKYFKVLRFFVKDLSEIFRRIQVHCNADCKFVRFARSFGFVQEGILKKFSPTGSDHVMMAIVRE